MGKCLTISKLVGIGSLGLSSASYLYEAEGVIPKLLKSGDFTSDASKKQITKLIVSARSFFWTCGAIGSYLFYEAFKCSPPEAKHPYLIYAAAVAPIAFLFNYYTVFQPEQRLLQACDDQPKVVYKKKAAKKAEDSAEETSPLDNSTYSDLGKDVTPTAAATASASSEAEADEDVSETPKEGYEPVEVPGEPLSADETKDYLTKIQKGYLISAGLLGVGFLLSIVGYLGDSAK